MELTIPLIICRVLSLITSILLPVALAIYICVKKRGSARALLAGAVCAGITIIITNLAYYGTVLTPTGNATPTALVNWAVSSPDFYYIVSTVVLAALTAVLSYFSLRFVSGGKSTALWDGLALGAGLWGFRTLVYGVKNLIFLIDISGSAFFVMSSWAEYLNSAVVDVCSLIITAAVALIIALALRKGQFKWVAVSFGTSVIISLAAYFGVRLLAPFAYTATIIRLVAAVLLALFAARELKKEGSEV